jgi:hypothetical protein
MQRAAHPWKESLLIFATALAAIFAARHDVLFSPPWQDQAAGLWAEADFLAQSHFDYYALRYRENHYLDLPSGPRSYMISILPTGLALLMVTMPSVKWVILIVRVGSFFCGAAILALVYYLLRKQTSRLPAALMVLALGTTPLYLTQVEIMGMDVPLGVLILIFVILIGRGNYVLAAVASALAFSIKATGQVATLAGIGFLLLVLVARPQARRQAVTGLVAHLFVLAGEIVLIAWGDTTVSIRLSAPWPASLRMPYGMWLTSPDVLVLLLLATAVSASSLIQQLTREGPRLRNVWHRLKNMPLQCSPAPISWMLLGVLLLSAWFYIYIPRYFFCGLPLLYLAIPATSFQRRGFVLCVMFGSLALAVFNVVNHEGRFFPDIESAAAVDLANIASLTDRSCMFRERSREYLADHRANIATIDHIKRCYGNREILVEPPYLFLLTKPRLGYVDKPLAARDASVLSSAMSRFCDGVQSSGGDLERLPLLVWYGESRLTLPPPEPTDVLYNDGQRTPLVIYCPARALAFAGNKRALEEWYLASTWSLRWADVRLRGRWPYLVQTGRRDQALAEVDEAIRQHPHEPRLKGIRQDILQATSDHEAQHRLSSR